MSKDIILALIQIRTTPLGPGLPSPAAILFNRPTKGALLKINRSLIFYSYDEDHYNMLKAKHDKVIQNSDTFKEHTVISIGFTVAAQGDMALDTWDDHEPQ